MNALSKTNVIELHRTTTAVPVPSDLPSIDISPAISNLPAVIEPTQHVEAEIIEVVDTAAISRRLLADAGFCARIHAEPSQISADEYVLLRNANMLEWFADHGGPATRQRRALIERDAFTAAVTAATRAVENRHTIPVLGNVMICERGGKLVITGTDLDIVIEAEADGAIEPGFAITLPARKLLEVTKKAKASDMVAIDVTSTGTRGKRWQETDGEWQLHPFDETEADAIALDFGGLNISLQGLPTADFPTMETGRWIHTFTLPACDLARALGRVEKSISEEETRYYLCGVNMHPTTDGRSLAFVATDGHRLAECHVELPDGAADMPGAIIPRKTVSELLRASKAWKQDVTVRVSVTHAVFTFGGVSITSKLVDGTFPDYQRVIPSGNDKALTVTVNDMIAAVKEVSVISSERGRAVKISLTADNAKLSVTNPDIGTAHTSLAVNYSSDPLDIGVNWGYLQDILGLIESDTATIMLADCDSPALIFGNDDADKGSRYVLMPMRV